jgi:hypothetical protein
VSLLTENGDTKDDLRLPSDDQLLSQVALWLEQIPFLCTSMHGIFAIFRVFPSKWTSWV